MSTKPGISRTVSRDSITPVVGTGNPLPIDHTLQAAKHGMDNAGHGIQLKGGTASTNEAHQAGDIIYEPQAVVST